MRLELDRLADQGCWISDDRVNAFISAATSGIAEVGYHGTQPVSKNSRIFVGSTQGAFSLALRRPDGTEDPVSFDEVDWTPSRVAVNASRCEALIIADGRSIRCRVTPQVSSEVRFTFQLSCLNINTHGTRQWSDPEVTPSSVILSCHDRIVLDEWLQRTGPYAGDFLIPEPMRRIIFDKSVRSGEASIDNLRPEYRDAAVPIYDAFVFVRIGGNKVRVEERDNSMSLVADASEENAVEFFIQFGDRRSDLETPLLPFSRRSTPSPVLSLKLPEYPSVEDFVSTVPGLVESAIVRDHGMPRATPAAYYWIWAWDSLVTGMEMLRWGDYASVRRMAAFVNEHRDEGGVIPGRWTRSLEPLDTPPRGALEFLFAALVYQYTLETGDLGPLTDAYPFLVNHLQELRSKADPAGMFPSSGFYPDFTSKFGRSPSSVVAMEVAAHYTFARVMGNVALLLSDTATERIATETAEAIDAHFLDRFWDDERSYLVDSYDMNSGNVNKSYPLFTMLFLQSSLGLPLIRSKIDAIARFFADELLGPFGTSLLPSWDRNRMNEDATASWYPHWDVYLLKLLRRGGRAEDIMRWLTNVERVLGHLGYCPEFIKLPLSDSDDPSVWLNHGAVSNLNCVTGWFRAIVEGLFGIEVDPGGLTILPLSLPLETLSFDGLVYKGGKWNVTVKNRGDQLEALVIDGTRWEGVCKIPARYYDGRSHSLEVLYGGNGPDLQFREIINADVIEVRGSAAARTVTVKTPGTCDLLFYAREYPDLLLDGQALDFEFDESTGIGVARLLSEGEVDLTLRSRNLVRKGSA